MKRWLVASGIFFGGMLVVFAAVAYKSYRQAPAGQALVFTPIFSRDILLVAIVLGVFAVWFSGRLIR
jgi:hypothetical protein